MEIIGSELSGMEHIDLTGKHFQELTTTVNCSLKRCMESQSIPRDSFGFRPFQVLSSTTQTISNFPI